MAPNDHNFSVDAVKHAKEAIWKTFKIGDGAYDASFFKILTSEQWQEARKKNKIFDLMQLKFF